jgi:hypothetical protein
MQLLYSLCSITHGKRLNVVKEPYLHDKMWLMGCTQYLHLTCTVIVKKTDLQILINLYVFGIPEYTKVAWQNAVCLYICMSQYIDRFTCSQPQWIQKFFVPSVCLYICICPLTVPEQMDGFYLCKVFKSSFTIHTYMRTYICVSEYSYVCLFQHWI